MPKASSMVLRCLRLTRALVFDQPHYIRADELNVVRAVANELNLAVRIPQDAELRSAPDETARLAGPFEVDVAYTWLREPRPGFSRAFVKSINRVAIPRVDAEEAPVAMRLRHRGLPLRLRRLGGGWLRPVLAPGNRSGAPISLSRFAECSASGVARLPVPDHPPQSRGRFLGRALLARRLRDLRRSARTGAPPEAAQEAEARLRERCSTFVAIGETVWKHTPTPRLRVDLCQSPNGWTPRVVWECGDLDENEPQDVFFRGYAGVKSVYAIFPIGYNAEVCSARLWSSVFSERIRLS